MIQITQSNFDLPQICQSGQCFRMNKENETTYSVIAGDHYLEVSGQDGQYAFDCDETEFENFWKAYFDLGSDYGTYRNRIDAEDSYLKEAAAFGFGIRILRQDLWEMIVTFLISQQNNIARIRKCVQNICTQYGEKKVNAKGKIFYAFPKPEAFAKLPEDALLPCNLGYRSKYVVRSAKSIVSREIDLDRISKMPYLEAKEELLKLYGIGEKVADCVCLFALHHLEAFPVDTHIKQAFAKHYPKGFPGHLYEGYQGVLQQYIFYYELFG